MKVSNIHAINVIQNFLTKVTSRNIKCQYIKVSNIHAINVTQNLLNQVTSRNLNCQYMKVSNIFAINVIQNLLDHLPSRHIKCTQCDSKFTNLCNLKKHKMSLQEKVLGQCNQ